MTTLVTVLFIGVLLGSGTMLELKLNEYRNEQVQRIKTSSEVRDGRGVDFAKLTKLNDDAKAWIYLPGTVIDYPVVQGEDNDFYLHRGLDKEYLFEGTLFIDAANENPFHDGNTVIYGHHMFSGSMFCSLEKFADEDYFRKHDTFRLTTAEGEFDLKAVAFCNESAESDLYTTYFDNGYQDEGYITDEGETAAAMTSEDFAALVREKAKVLSNESFDGHDTFVTLSTCAYNYEDARHQVICVMRPPALVEKTEVTYEPVDAVKNNIWLLAQIGVGAVMAIAVLSPLAGVVRRRKEKKHNA